MINEEVNTQSHLLRHQTEVPGPDYDVIKPFATDVPVPEQESVPCSTPVET